MTYTPEMPVYTVYQMMGEGENWFPIEYNLTLLNACAMADRLQAELDTDRWYFWVEDPNGEIIYTA